MKDRYGSTRVVSLVQEKRDDESVMNKHLALNVSIKTSQTILIWQCQKVVRLPLLAKVNSGILDNKSMNLNQRIWFHARVLVVNWSNVGKISSTSIIIIPISVARIRSQQLQNIGSESEHNYTTNEIFHL